MPLTVTQTTVMQDLSYLLGETTVPTTSVEDRQRFIQAGLERIYRIWEFPFSEAVATVSLSSGVGSLPTDARFAPNLDVRVINPGNNADYIFEQIPYEDQDKYAQGSYKFWLLQGSDGVNTLNTVETTIPAVTVRYSLMAPVINASIATPFPSSMVIAKAALIYYRQAEDPLADTSVEEQNFQGELREIIASYRRNKGRRRIITRQELGGHVTGGLINDYVNETNSNGY